MKSNPTPSPKTVTFATIVIVLAIFAIAWMDAAEAQEPRTATITFTRPTHYTDGTPIPEDAVITYDVYQGPRGGAKTVIGTITETHTEITSGLERGKEYCFQVTAVVGSEASDPSNEECKAFRVPQTVTITVR